MDPEQFARRILGLPPTDTGIPVRSLDGVAAVRVRPCVGCGTPTDRLTFDPDTLEPEPPEVRCLRGRGLGRSRSACSRCLMGSRSRHRALVSRACAASGADEGAQVERDFAALVVVALPVVRVGSGLLVQRGDEPAGTLDGRHL